MRSRVVDTSVLVAYADVSDAHHHQAAEMLGEPGPVVVPNEVLVETAGVLAHRSSRAAARAFVAGLQATEGIELGHETDMDAGLALQLQFPKLSIVDACAVTLAWRLGAGLDTFDNNQRKAWRSR